MKGLNIAIIGATGLVGKELLSLLEKRAFPISKLLLFASEKSQGQEILCNEKKYSIQALSGTPIDVDMSFFCAGSSVSKKHISSFPNSTIIDSSSYFRMEKDVPLIIPEINGHLLEKKPKLIASPNCTTTMMLMALYPLHKQWGLKKIVVSTYQAASGGGKKLMDKLEKDTISKSTEPSSYGYNVFLHESTYENGFCLEEKKMIFETKKILEDDTIEIFPTCVRVPVLRAHSLSLHVEFHKEVTLPQARLVLSQMEGLTLKEDYSNKNFPTPLEVTNKESVYCGRIRQNPKAPNTLDLWVVGDQLLKGAALNSLQIAEKLLS